MAVAHKYSWCDEFFSLKEFQDWFKEEEFHQTMTMLTKKKDSKGAVKFVYSCAFNNSCKKPKDGKSCPCRLVVFQIFNSIHITYYPIHSHSEKIIRKRRVRRVDKTSSDEKGILVRPRSFEDGECASSEEYEGKCTECDEVFNSKIEHQKHMAVVHEYYWIYEFATENEFQTWFRKEDLEGNMDLKRYRINLDGTVDKEFHCSYNKEMDFKIGTKDACPCRVTFKQDDNGVVVKYYALHDHLERPTDVTKEKKSIVIKWPRPSASNEDSQSELSVERKCQECGVVLTCDKDYEIHLATIHDYFFQYQFASSEDYRAWFNSEGFHETMHFIKRKNRNGELSKTYYFCAYNRLNKKDKCPCHMIMTQNEEQGIVVYYKPLHNHFERAIKPIYSRTHHGPGIPVKWPRPASNDPSVPPGEEKCERKCPECAKILLCDKDFELHVAVVHDYHWRYKFDTEDEFNVWFKAEGFEETIVKRHQRKNMFGFTNAFYSCAFNTSRTKEKNETCSCRIHVHRDPYGIHVRYYAKHSHSHRVTRHRFTDECRAMVFKMIRDGYENSDILRTVKQTYPRTSVNQMMRVQNLSSYRKRLQQRSQNEKKDSKTNYVSFRARKRKSAVQRSKGLNAKEVPSAHFSSEVKYEENVIESLDSSNEDEGDAEIDILLSPRDQSKREYESDCSLDF